MKKIIYSCIAFCILIPTSWAEIGNLDQPDGGIEFSSPSIIGILSIIQSILLKAVLPLIVVGSALYIAYQLLTAEGDEARLKQAWRSLGYSSVALITVALSYALVSIFSNMQL